MTCNMPAKSTVGQTLVLPIWNFPRGIATAQCNRLQLFHVLSIHQYKVHQYTEQFVPTSVSSRVEKITTVYFQILQEKIEQLQDICNKKDKCLQSNKMIVKFRDNNIARLEKIVKDKQDVEPALQETIVRRSPKVAALFGFHLLLLFLIKIWIKICTCTCL